MAYETRRTRGWEKRAYDSERSCRGAAVVRVWWQAGEVGVSQLSQNKIYIPSAELSATRLSAVVISRGPDFLRGRILAFWLIGLAEIELSNLGEHKHVS